MHSLTSSLLKRSVSGFITMLLLGVCTTISAHDFEAKSNGTTIYFNLAKGGNAVEITFQGSKPQEVDNEYKGEIIIPSAITVEGKTYPVTAIGEGAFQGCDELVTIHIPASVTSISDHAFLNCKRLTSVFYNLPASQVFPISETTFLNVNPMIILNVPESSRLVFRREKGWSSFTNIIATDQFQSAPTLSATAAHPIDLSVQAEPVVKLTPTAKTKEKAEKAAKKTKAEAAEKAEKAAQKELEEKEKAEKAAKKAAEKEAKKAAEKEAKKKDKEAEKKVEKKAEKKAEKTAEKKAEKASKKSSQTALLVPSFMKEAAESTQPATPAETTAPATAPATVPATSVAGPSSVPSAGPSHPQEITSLITTINNSLPKSMGAGVGITEEKLTLEDGFVIMPYSVDEDMNPNIDALLKALGTSLENNDIDKLLDLNNPQNRQLVKTLAKTNYGLKYRYQASKHPDLFVQKVVKSEDLKKY